LTTQSGDYPIIAAMGNLTASNYSFTFVDGTLTVTLVGSPGSAGISKIESLGTNVRLTLRAEANEWCSIIAADGNPGGGWRVMETVISAPQNYLFTDSDAISSITSRFYRVVTANEGVISTNPATYGVYIKPMMTGTWYRVSMPLDVDPSNRMDAGLGKQLANGLANGDRLYAMTSVGGWHSMKLNSQQWTTSGVPVAVEINPCQGYWVKRMSDGANSLAVYAGMTRTGTQTMVFRAKDWALVAWPFATPRRQDQGSPGWGFAACGAKKGTSGMTADQLTVGEGANAVTLILKPDGYWYRSGATTPAWDVTLRAGEAYYYYHNGTGFTWTVTQE
jgi:hypothetical protein